MPRPALPSPALPDGPITRPRSRRPGPLFLLLALPGLALATATDPGSNGPYPAVRETISIPGTQNASLTTDLYYPGTLGEVSAAAGQCPVIVLGHGFSQSKDQHVNQGRHLATRGYVVLIPNSNAASDHSRYADELRRCLDWIGARHTDPASPFLGRIRTNRAGASGHSAGGLSAILAAARDPRIRAVSVMDPVDNGGQGVAALTNLSAPVAITFSEPSSCNANGSALTLYQAARAPKRGLKIVGANHTDPQDPAGALSVLFCGAANAARQTLYRRYTVGWFEFHLRDDAAYGPWVFTEPNGQLAADLAAQRITYDAALAPRAAWRWVHFGPDTAAAGDIADPDDDRLMNLFEYAFNTDPLRPNETSPTYASLVHSDTNRHLALTFTQVATAIDLTYRVESSGNLRTWIPGPGYSGTNATPGPGAVEHARAASGRTTLVVRDAEPAAGSSPRYLRLLISAVEEP